MCTGTILIVAWSLSYTAIPQFDGMALNAYVIGISSANVLMLVGFQNARDENYFGILALGAVVGLKYFRNEDEEEDFFDFDDVGPTTLTCPSCSGQITITTDQRPIQVGCPMCQSQFIIRE